MEKTFEIIWARGGELKCLPRPERESQIFRQLYNDVIRAGLASERIHENTEVRSITQPSGHKSLPSLSKSYKGE